MGTELSRSAVLKTYARWAPVYDVVSHLVYAVTPQDVVTTIVDGRVLMRERKVLTLDAGEVRAAAQRKGAEIAAALAKDKAK